MRTVVVLAALLAALLSPPPAHAARAADRPHAAARKTVTVAYGDPAVAQDRAKQRVRIRFRGVRGDRVRLDVPGIPDCATVELRRGDTQLTQDRAGYYRLLRRGWHEFTFRPCPRAQTRYQLQLTKLRVRPLVADAAAVRVEPQDGFDDALRGRVLADRMTLVRATRGLRAFLPPTGPLVPVGNTGFGKTLQVPLFLSAGRPLEDVFGPQSGDLGDSELPLAAGDPVLLFPAVDSTWTASTPVPHDAAIDGDQVGLATDGVRGRAQEVTFDGESGQWIRLETTPGPDGAWLREAHQQLLDSEGLRVGPTLPGLWRLPADGSYRLTLTPGGRASGDSAVRLLSVPDLPTLSADGSPTTFATTKPGQWVVAPVAQLADVEYELRATDSTMDGPWALDMTTAHLMTCGRPPGPNGCGDWNGGSVSSDRLLTTPWTTSGYAYVAVLIPGDGVGGQVTVTLRPQD